MVVPEIVLLFCPVVYALYVAPFLSHFVFFVHVVRTTCFAELTNVAGMLDSLNFASYFSALRTALFDRYTMRLPCCCSAATPSSAPAIGELKSQIVPNMHTRHNTYTMFASPTLIHCKPPPCPDLNGRIFTITVGHHVVERIDEWLALLDGQLEQIPDAVVAINGVGHRGVAASWTFTAKCWQQYTRLWVWVNTDAHTTHIARGSYTYWQYDCVVFIFLELLSLPEVLAYLVQWKLYTSALITLTYTTSWVAVILGDNNNEYAQHNFLGPGFWKSKHLLGP